jgi:hypothetical protein
LNTLFHQTENIGQTARIVDLLSNWYNDHIFVTYLPLVVLYIISGITKGDSFPLPTRLLWLVPPLLVCFLTITLLPRLWDMVPRYFFPAVPILCILASRFFDFKFLQVPKKRREFMVSLAVMTALGASAGFVLLQSAHSLDWAFKNFLYSIFNPLVFSLFVGLLMFLNKQTAVTSAILIACLFCLNMYSIRDTLKAWVFGTVTARQQGFDWLFYPYASFSSQLEYDAEMTLLIPVDIHTMAGMLGGNEDEIMDMYNVYFDSSAVSSNFIYERDLAQLPIDLLENDYTYAILSKKEWGNMIEQPGFQSEMAEKYNFYYDPLEVLVLLKHSE